MSASETTEQRLADALAECERLREENERLRERLEPLQIKPTSTPLSLQFATTADGIITAKSSPEEKVNIFRSLFRGREDVYALRWEGRNSKTGYSPAYRKVWGASFRQDSAEPKEYFPLTDQVIQDHLTGKVTVGLYPLLTDETCWFLAADFDKASWQDDVHAYLQTCAEWNVPAALERSRSGRGGHVWVFFDSALPAGLARKLGAAILTRTMERRHQLGLDSYDRFFPSQDTMPKGGFGNLIALPLQHLPRSHGHSVFLVSDFVPHPDQWAFLSGVRRMSFGSVQAIAREAERCDLIVGVRRSVTDDDSAEDPWTLPPSRRKKDEPISGPLPAVVRITRSNLVYVEKEGLPSVLLNRLHRLAAFQNPEFYRAQAMRLSTFGKPRVIRCAEEFARHVALPRGCLDEVTTLLKSHKVEVKINDQRFEGQPIDVTFHGQLRPEQPIAVDAKAQALVRPFAHVVIPRPTNFRLPPSTEKPEMHEMYAALATNEARNQLITVDLLRAIKAGRSPIVLTERTGQVDEFAKRLDGLAKHIVVMKGGMGTKQRREMAERLKSIPEGEERVLLATGRYIGEGFDDARLATLFLAMPISWRGTLQQYVGRLHRLHDAKREVIVYDYVDGCIPVFCSMYDKRVRGYEAVGYMIRDD